MKDRNLRTLAANFTSLSVLQALGYLLPVLVFPYLSRVLGPAKFGAVAFAHSLMVYFQSITDYGFKLTATRDIAAHRHDTAQVDEIFSSVMYVRLALTALAALAVFLLVSFVPRFRADPWLYYFSFGYVVGNVLLPVWYLQGVENMKYITMLAVGAGVVFAALIFVFVGREAHYVYVPLFNALGWIAAGAAGLVLVLTRFGVRFRPFDGAMFKGRLRSGFSVFLTDFVPNLYNNSTVFILGAVSSDSRVGYYSAATKIVDAINSLPYVLARTYFPLLNRDFTYYRTFRRLILGAGFVLSLLTFLGSEWLVTVLLSNRFEASVLPLKIISWSPLFLSMMLCYGTNYLLVQRLDGLYMRLTIVASVVGFAAGLVLIPRWVEIGASITLVGTRALLAMACYVAAKQNEGSRRASN